MTRNTTTIEWATACNIGLENFAVQGFVDSFMVNKGLVLRSRICGKNLHPR